MILTWFKNYVLTSKAYREAVAGDNPVVVGINNPKSATFRIKDIKLYVPDVTFSTQDDNELLEQLKKDLQKQLNGINIGHK